MPARSQFQSKLSIIRAGKGQAGGNIEHVLRTFQHLEDAGVHDPLLSELVVALRDERGLSGGGETLGVRGGQVQLDLVALLGCLSQEVDMHLVGAELGALMAETGKVQCVSIVVGLAEIQRLGLPSSWRRTRM